MFSLGEIITHNNSYCLMYHLSKPVIENLAVLIVEYGMYSTDVNQDASVIIT